jgi:hypothetical protein
MTTFTPAPARRSAARRILAGLVAVPLILATVVLARLIDITTPIGMDHERPWIHQGQMNEPVLERDIEVTVHDVRGTRAYAASFGNTQTTDGLFLLVRLTVVAPEAEAAALRYADLFDDAGIGYSAIDEFETIMNYELLPGIPVEGDLLFEVPAGVATQLRLRLSSVNGYWGQYQVMVEVPLEIDADEVDDWYSDVTPLTLTRPEVAG